MQTYIYARWSSLEQTAGSTLERQIANCTAYVDQRQLEVTETIVDAGRSAYTGSNITSGNLGTFAKRVVSGAVPRGSRLVVEELDRLSRQPADVMMTWLSPLVRAGLSICVTQTGQIIDSQMLDHDMGGLMMLMITAFGSNKESRKKSERVASAWDKKRRDARAGLPVVTSHRHPGWLKPKEGGFDLIPERVEIVKFIFDQRLKGFGKGMTAKTLNERKVPTFRKAIAWTATYVGRVLCNRAVLGEWQPYSSARGDEVRKPVGEPISGFYPAVISEADFAAANSDKIAQQLRHQGRGKGITNLLGRRARCAVCGGLMSAKGSAGFKLNADGTKTRHYFLYCIAAKEGSGCTHQIGWTYDRIERPLLDHILTLAMDDQHFTSDDTDVSSFETAVLAAKGRVKDIEVRVNRLLDMIEDGDSDAQDRYRARREELVEAKGKLEKAEKELAEARGAVSPEEHVRRVSEVRSLLDSEDAELKYQARQRVKAALQDIITDMQFNPVTKVVDVGLVGGLGAVFINHNGSSQFVNMHKPGRRHSDGDYTPEVKAAIEATTRRIETAKKANAPK